MLKLTELQVSSRNHPIGLDEQPVFSWKMVSDIPDTIQTAYRVRVGSWDTGRVESGDSLFVPYAGPALQPRTAYRVQVEVWDNHGQYGEDYDAAAPAAAPRPPLLPGLDKKNLIAQEDEPVRCVQMLPVVKDFLAPNGEWVLDFGQNITGVVHAKLDLPAGAQVRLRHAESLDENGNFYTGNLSFAKSEDTFRSAGQPAEYLPRFTCHGFRYLCVEGLPESQRDPAAFTACVLTTDLRRTGQFRCSDERVNRLQSNIQWSRRIIFWKCPPIAPSAVSVLAGQETSVPTAAQRCLTATPHFF